MPGAQGIAVIDHREGAARAAYRADWVAGAVPVPHPVFRARGRLQPQAGVRAVAWAPSRTYWMASGAPGSATR